MRYRPKEYIASAS
jgi:hypothetical protein